MLRGLGHGSFVAIALVMLVTARGDIDYEFGSDLSRVPPSKGAITRVTLRSEVVMSGSLLNKGNAALNAIAITTALAIISGYLPVRPVSITQIQSALQAQLQDSRQ
ncbi:MAG TPA: hypothetical protein V6C98_16405 [Thermosynechococcaceae cyanobacterium]